MLRRTHTSLQKGKKTVANTGLAVCRTTIQFNKKDIHGRVARKKPSLQPEHKIKYQNLCFSGLSFMSSLSFAFCIPMCFLYSKSPCVLVSAVCYLIDCCIPQVFSIVCHYLPVSVLIKPQCFSFWLLVLLMPFCTCTFLPTPGSSLLYLFCVFPVSGFSFSVFALTDFPRLALDSVLLDFPSGTSALPDCSLVLTPACVLDLSARPIKHLPLELYLESAHGSSVPDSDIKYLKYA